MITVNIKKHPVKLTLSSGGLSAEGKDTNIVLILDTSRSMNKGIAGEASSRLQALKDVVNILLTELSDSHAHQEQGLGLAKGSGWAVFEELEDNDPSWDRQDTRDYIRNNAEALAAEDEVNNTGACGGDDILKGGMGNDIIFGQEGDDTITGGQGSDLLSGGSGDDTFRFDMLDLEDSETITTITDFDINNDSLSFTNVVDDLGQSSNQLEDVDANIESINNIDNTNDVSITMNSGAQIVIEDFGPLAGNVDGLGDLPDLIVQVDII